MPQVAFEAPPAALPVKPKVLADKYIGPEIEPDKQEQEDQYEDVLEEKDVSSSECFIASNGKSNLIKCTLTIPTKSAQTA